MSTPVRRRRIPSLLLVVVVATGSMVYAADASSKRTTKAAPTGITIKDFAFKPDKFTGKVGKAISVINADRVMHTLTADDKSFDTGRMGGGAKKTITITKAGTYKFHCDIHQYMKGTVTVK